MSEFGFIFLCCFLVVNCQNQALDSNTSMGTYTFDDALAIEDEIQIEPPRSAEPTAPPGYELEKVNRVIKNGSMKFQVSDLKGAKIKADSLLSRTGGYYENEQYNSYGNRVSYSLSIRVPNVKFDSLVFLLEKGVRRLEAKNVNVNDVTEEYVDLSIRLNNNLAYLNQYREILKKARSVKDILEVQEKIRTIEEEIERNKGRLKYLNDKIMFSTLKIEITKFVEAELSNTPGFGQRIANAFHSGIQVFLNILVRIVGLWPFLVLLLFVVLGRKAVLSNFQKRNAI